MKTSHRDEDYKNMAQCYSDCGGNLQNARRLYHKRHGTWPTSCSVKMAVEEYGKNEESRTQDYDPSTHEEHNILSTVIKKERLDPEEALINDEDRLIISMESCPIVYTTRLDDMLIFNKNFERLDVDDIVENIIIESKPMFKKMPIPCENPLKQIINPYFRLVENVRKFNQLSDVPISYYSSQKKCKFPDKNINNYVTSLTLKYGLHKELYVVLEDCKIKPGYVAKVRRDGNEYIVTEVVPFKRNQQKVIREQRYSIDDHLGSSSSQPMLIPRNSNIYHLKIMKYKSVIFLNDGTCTTDMYSLNKNGIPTSYCMLSRLVTLAEMPVNSLVTENCCWFTREKNIENLMSIPTNNKIAFEIMRKPHSCPPGKCSCCCKLKANSFNDETTHQIAQNKSEARTWLTSIQSLQRENENNFISKALNYSRKKNCLDNVKTEPTDAVNELPKHIVITNNYASKTESYTVQNNGNIKKLIEVDSTNKAAFNRLQSATSNPYVDKVCCWSKRDWMLWVMQSSHNCSSHNAINFMRTPHDCTGVMSGEDCSCCCKPTKSLSSQLPMAWSPPLDTTPLGKKIVHVKKYISKTFLRQKKYNKTTSDDTRHKIVLKKSIYTNLLLPKPIYLTPQAQLQSCTNQTQSSLQKVTTAFSANSVPDSVKQTFLATQAKRKSTSTQSTTPAKRKLTSTENNAPSAPTQIKETAFSSLNQQNLTTHPQQNIPQTNSLLSMVDSENQDPTVNSLVQSILHRFRDVRLTCTPEGEVSAELSTPIQNLSTAELKILSAILTHAKEQVKTLKENPGIHVSTNTVSSIYPAMSNPPILQAAVAGVSSSNSLPQSQSQSKILFIPNGPSTSIPATSETSSFMSSPVTNHIATNNRQLELTNQSNIMASRQAEAVTDSHQCYTNLSALKLQNYVQSCKSFINNSKSVLPVQTRRRIESDQANNLHSPLGESSVSKRPASTNTRTKKIKSKPAFTAPTNTVVPSTSLMNSSLQDLVSSPFAPPQLASIVFHPTPPPLISQTPIINQNLINVLPAVTAPIPFPQLQIGPAFSLRNSDDDDIVVVEDNSTKADEECILGF